MKLSEHIDQIPTAVKAASDIGVWGAVLTGWLGILQPELTAIATILAIIWTSMQIYGYIKKNKKKKNG